MCLSAQKRPTLTPVNGGKQGGGGEDKRKTAAATMEEVEEDKGAVQLVGEALNFHKPGVVCACVCVCVCLCVRVLVCACIRACLSPPFY